METPDYTKMSLDELHAELKKLHDLFWEALRDDRMHDLQYFSEKIGKVLHAIDIKLTKGMQSAKRKISN